ncbi:retrovirus-related pol polyprotein from transposon TNT 1-94 [Tanacetum coccineum]|uniref:Retrovirus-related pol polyprotein from transposon TNT 1-94 n=1 Tax=Tanacetum coccineum TaxID=301880 RepID=A0ABQ5AU25_9ASTR
MAEDGKLKIDSMMVMISVSSRGYDRGQEAEQKQVEIMDKEVNQAARDSDDALVCCIENTVEDHIMDSGALFHATYCKEELKGSSYAPVSWTLKDVRYIPSLKRRLISVGQLDKEGYHVGFKDQQWKVTKGSLVVAHRNKRGSLYMVEIGMSMLASKDNVPDVRKSKFIHKAVVLHLLHQSEDPATMILLSKTAAGVTFCVENGIVMLKMVPETPLQFGVAERLSRTFRAESTGLRVEVPKMLWADSVSTSYLIYCIPYFPIGLRIPEEEWQGKDTSLTHLKLSGYEESPGYPKQRYYICGLDLWSQLKSGLSSEITQSLGGSSDTSEGSENSGSFEDSGRSDEEYSEDGASSKEGGSETPQVRRSTRESRAPVRYSPSANYLLLTENGEPESYSEALSSKESVQWKKAIIEEMVSLEKNQTCSLVRISAGKKASQRLWMFNWQEKEPSYVGALNDTSTQHKSEGFQLAGQEENLECRLKEILYGLIQAPRLRYLKFDSFMQKDKAPTWQSSTSLSGSFP